MPRHREPEGECCTSVGRILHPRHCPSQQRRGINRKRGALGYGFPEDGDPTLDAACEALSDALQNASTAMVKHDTAEVKLALDNLRKAYDEATISNTVVVHYIDVEPPSAPYSPLKKPNLGQILLARSWMKELINGLRDQSLSPQVLVIGNPGSGEFLRFFLPLMPSSVCTAKYYPGKNVALVGHLLFYLTAQGERTILQSQHRNGRLGFLFNDCGVHEVFAQTLVVTTMANRVVCS